MHSLIFLSLFRVSSWQLRALRSWSGHPPATSTHVHTHRLKSSSEIAMNLTCISLGCNEPSVHLFGVQVGGSWNTWTKTHAGMGRMCKLPTDGSAGQECISPPYKCSNKMTLNEMALSEDLLQYSFSTETFPWPVWWVKSFHSNLLSCSSIWTFHTHTWLC